jgi:hypothetical protein
VDVQRGCGAGDFYAGVREGVDGLDRHLALVVGEREETRLLLTDA